MKSYQFLIVFVLFSSIASAQDLIVTAKNDSINCKIERDDFEYIFYSIKQADSNISTKISLTEVRNIRYNYFINKKVVKSEPYISTLVYYPVRTFRISVNTGIAYVTAKTLSTDDKELDKHFSSLKLGYQYGLGAYTFGKKSIGYELTYKHYFNQNKNDEYLYIDSVNGNRIGELSDRVNINFYAISLINKTSFFNNKMDLYLGVSGGYLHYKNNNIRLSEMIITGNTLGIMYTIGVDYYLNYHFALGADFNLLQATMRKYTYEINGTEITKSLDKSDYENISRIDFSAGLRYYLLR